MGYTWVTYGLHMCYIWVILVYGIYIYDIYIWFIYGLYMGRMGYSSVTY